MKEENSAFEKRPLVTVAMPVYNGEKWLHSAIDSVLNQTFTDFELVISDNASTDDSEAICREYQQKDSRVRYYRNEKNIGVSENFNVAFKRGSGKYVKWATTNDYIKPNMLERCVEQLEKNEEIVLSYCKTRLFNPDQNYEEDYEDKMHLMQDSAATRLSVYFDHARLNNVLNGVIRREALEKTKLYKRYISADTNMVAELTLYGKFCEVPEYLFYRRMDPESATKLKPMEDVWRYYDPDNERKMIFQHWKFYFDLFIPVVSAPLALGEKVKILVLMLKRSYWAKSDLWHDLKTAVTGN